jgi:Fic family protein
MNQFELLSKIHEQRERLKGLLPLPESQQKNLDDYQRVELTYTSNAIEGNTLTRQQTALVVEEGISVAGKELREIQEAINHARAWDSIVSSVSEGQEPKDVTESFLLEIHSQILDRINDHDKGKYRNQPVYITGSRFVPPNYLKVPELMEGFINWLHSRQGIDPICKALEAHYRLVSIHPFTDGNGRTSRLLMNVLLRQQGIPPAIVRPEDREVYIASLEKAHIEESLESYYQVMLNIVSRSLDDYLNLIEPKNEPVLKSPTLFQVRKLMKIGELAVETGQNKPTLRYWTKEGLLEVKEYTQGGLFLYEPSAIDKVKTIRRLQNERHTIAEIKEILKG